MVKIIESNVALENYKYHLQKNGKNFILQEELDEVNEIADRIVSLNDLVVRELKQFVRKTNALTSKFETKDKTRNSGLCHGDFLKVLDELNLIGKKIEDSVPKDSDIF